MPQAKTRISRKDIRRPDQFMVTTRRVMEIARSHRQKLTIAGIAIIVILGGVVAWELYDRHRDNEALRAYNRALDAYEAGRYQEALGFFREVKGYGATPHRELASLYIGNAQLALDRPKEAIETLQALADGVPADSLTGQLALLTLALAQEIDNACDAALESVEKVIQGSGPFRQEALLAKARCSVRIGRVDDAIRSYRDYLERFPDSPQISLKIQELEAARSAGG